MISDKMLSHDGALKSPFKIYKIIYRILCPFVVFVGVFAAILALFPAKEGGNARMNALIVFLVMAAAIGALVSFNHAFEKNNAYSRYLPKFLEKINFSVVVPLAVMVIVTLLPFYVLLITSVKTSAEANAVGFTWWPREGFEFGNYKYVFDMMDGLRINPFIAFLNSMLYALIPTLVGVVVSGISAFAFAKLKFPGSEILYRFMMFTVMIPGCILTSSSYLYFDVFGWVGNEGPMLPLLIPGCFGGVITVMFIREYFMGVPDSIFEAAKLDGAGRMQMFFMIALPVAMPAFIAQFIFNAIGGYNNYLGPLIYGKYPEQFTITLALQFIDGQATPRERLSAAGIFGLLPMMILYLIFQKKIISGISISSGIKG